ncbi:MAG: glycosyltransferase family 2 protein [Gammaproteobacteria bacterium]
MSLSIVIPAKDEAAAIGTLLADIRRLHPDAELIVVDDGSTDDTALIAGRYATHVVRHLHPMGNGAAIKSGARRASGDILVTMDADGQHRAGDIARLVAPVAAGEADMIVGARSADGHANLHRFAANTIYNWLASWMANYPIADLTSGMRAARRDLFVRFLYLFPNGFSYPTTVTMAFLRSGFRVGYHPIAVQQRIGKSHIKLFRDGVRFLLIIFKIGSLYSPLKLFLPISLAVFAVATGWYGYTWLDDGRFTNMSALLYSTSLLIFLMGLISEQITQLFYKDVDRH